MAEEPRFGVGKVTRFYVPLLLQAFSQSLSYPLVAGIVTHGQYGVHALTAFSQGLMIMFMIGALGGGLVTTGMVFAKTWYGYVSFRRLNAVMMGVLLAAQCLPALPPFSGWLFEGFFNLPPELAEISRQTLLWGVVMNAGFFLRNVPMVVLFNRLESGKANNATMARIAATVACTALFPKLGWTGPFWGLLALTFGVWVELVTTYLYARPFVAELPNRPSVPTADLRLSAAEVSALTLEQFRFTLPLALGGFLLASSPLVIAAFVARTAHAADMLAIHYVTLGVANPVAYAALRLQTVAVKFLPEYPGDRRLLVYAVAAGAVLGIIPLAFATPWIGNWYFGTFQNVPPRILGTARLAIGIYSLISIIHAVRARIEGIAAARKEPKAVMAGQIAYTASLFLVCVAMLPLGCPGWVMAITAIFVAPTCVTATVYAALARAARRTLRSAALTLALVVAAVGTARAEEAEDGKTTDGGPFKVDGWASVWFGNGYMSSSGNLSDTKPVCEQDVLFNVRTKDYGWLSLENWAKSNLHGYQDASHRRFLYIYEGVLTYGYAHAFSDDVKLVTDAGGVWDWLIAYKSDPPDEWYWIARQSLENPYVTPFWNALGGISPYDWARVRCGLRRGFRVTDALTVTPMGEMIWVSDGLYDMRYGGDPDLRFLGGGFAACWVGFKFNWNFYGNWSIWGRFRQYVLIDPTAREVVDARDAYNAKLDYPLVNLGLATTF